MSWLEQFTSNPMRPIWSYGSPGSLTRPKAAARPPQASSAGEFYSNPNSHLAPAAARPKKDPRYTSSGAPIPEKFGQPSGLVGGGNAGATGSTGTGRRTANPASNPPRVTPRTEVQSQALGTALQQAQGPSFWESNTALKEAAENGPKAGTAGYANRADIRAWMDAMNKTESGKAMVQRFLDKERKAGRLGAAAPTTDALATAAGQDVRAFQQREAEAAGMRFVDKSGLPAGTADNAWLGSNGTTQPSDLDLAIAAGQDVRAFQQREAEAAGRQFVDRSGLPEMIRANAWLQADQSTPSSVQPAFDPNEVLNQVGAQRELPTWQSNLELGQPVVPKGQAMAAAQQPALEAQMDFTDTSAYANPLLQEHLRRARLGL